MVAALVVTPPINRTMELREDEIKMKLHLSGGELLCSSCSITLKF